jgi:hypothetical protein
LWRASLMRYFYPRAPTYRATDSNEVERR